MLEWHIFIYLISVFNNVVYPSLLIYVWLLWALLVLRTSSSGKLRDGSVNKLVEVKGLELYCNPFQSSHEVMRDDAVDSNSQGRELEANNDRCILVPLDVSLSLSVCESYSQSLFFCYLFIPFVFWIKWITLLLSILHRLKLTGLLLWFLIIEI